VETLWRWERDAEHATPVSMEGDGGSGTASRGAVRDLLVGDDGREIEDRITRREEVALLRDEILELGERERLVLSLYYFEELKLHEIASLLGVTESRISQIRSAAIGRLRRRLARLRECCSGGVRTRSSSPSRRPRRSRRLRRRSEPRRAPGSPRTAGRPCPIPPRTWPTRSDACFAPKAGTRPRGARSPKRCRRWPSPEARRSP